ncbi:MAG TPA: class I SAM-dependent methyltransferase [Solirubrobacterales bacterium]|nr:class I SAM-dependent methyltransferase [Solirubrobacterales bacterium]
MGTDRELTSHERRAGQWWDESYRDGTAPWDIGRPQSAFERLAAAGRWTGAVLDVGCGTGEHALRAAELGLTALGVDVAETALEIAARKAAARLLPTEFAYADALHLDHLHRKFDTVLDCGLLHTFDAVERRTYVASLATVTDPGATLFVLCFRAGAPTTEGPHPIEEEELRATFVPDVGWRLAELEPSRIEVTFEVGEFPAWLATVERC